MGMNNILPERDGAKVSIYDVLLYNQWQCQNAEKKDVLSITYRDEQGKKQVKHIQDPKMEIYFVKDQYRSQFKTPREYLPKEELEPRTVPAKYVINEIYKEMSRSYGLYGDPLAKKYMQIHDNSIAIGKYSGKKEVFKWPYALMADMNVEEYYWVQLGYHYDLMHGHVIDKCFADIENDIYGMSSAEQACNTDPVNAVTLIFTFDDNGPNKGKGLQVYTYLLRNHERYPQQEDFEKHLKEFEKQCHDEFDHQTVIKNGKKKVIDTVADYHIKFFDQEENLLREVFKTINKFKPDLCEFWNMPYDMPKMQARMEMLHMNPTEVICDSDFFPKAIQFYHPHMDTRPIDIANRNSYIRASSTTRYVDQMQNYAGIRKGRKAYGSNSLDNIAEIELGMGKRKFRKGVDVRNACVLDYWNFVLYNIRDVWCQQLIDTVTNDSMAMIYDMNQQNCALHHLIKQTKYQRYIYYAWYLRKGFVPGNNVNTDYLKFHSEEEQEYLSQIEKRRRAREMLDKAGIDPDDIEEILSDPEQLAEFTEDDVEQLGDIASIDQIADEEVSTVFDTFVDIYRDGTWKKLPLPGGLVGNPDFNLANGTELIPGVPSKHIFDNVMDEDYASEYPWAKFTRSLSRSTQYGRLIIPEKISEYQNILPLGQKKRKSDMKHYLPGAEFTSDYISQDYMSFGAVWFNLPLVDEMNDLIDKELGIIETDGKEIEQKEEE